MKPVLLFLIASPFFLYAQQSKVDSALTIINKHRHDSTEIKTLCWLGATSKDPQKSVEFYRKAISVFNNYNPGPWGAYAFIRMARLKSGLGENDSTQIYLLKAKQIIDHFPTHSKKLQYEFYNTSGVINKNQANYDEALKFYNLSVQLGDRVIGKDNMAGNYLNIANVYTQLGKLQLAQDYLFKSLKSFEELSNEDGMSYCYNGLGNLFHKQKIYSKAELYIKKSIALKEKNGNKKAVATGLNGLAILYMDTEAYPKALENIDKAIALCKEYKMKDHLCEGYLNKGLILYRFGKTDEALPYYLDAKTIAEEMGNTSLLASVNNELGQLYQRKSDSKKALATLLKGVEQGRSSRNLEVEKNAHEALAEYYYKNNQFKEAFNESILYRTLNDSLESLAIKMKLYDLEGKYESEKKEKEIVLLKKDQELKNIELQRERTIQYAVITFAVLLGLIGFLAVNRYRVIQRSRRLAAIERMRNNVARDLHDNIGSTLSSINIISQLALNESKPDNYPQHFRRIGEQSLRMMENMSDMVWSINPNNDSIEKMVIRMKEFSAEILEPNNISYTFLGEEVFNGAVLDVEKRKNLFLIFKEAINNTAKYSEATVVTIILSKIDHSLSLFIQDNGKGFDPLKIKNGNGLSNMKERATQTGGSFSLKTSPGEGTVVSLTIPIT